MSEFSKDLILGFSPIIIAVGITILGLAFRIGIGISRRDKPINAGHIFTSLVIGFFASLPIVATSLSNIPSDIDDLPLFVMLVGMIGTIMGIDAGVKSAGKKIMAMKKPQVDNGDDPPV